MVSHQRHSADGPGTPSFCAAATNQPSLQVERAGSIVSFLMGGAEQSRVDLDRPERLEFEYMQQMTLVLDGAFAPGAPVRAMHVGGCGCALAWAWEVQRPGSRQLAVEVDAAVAEAARSELPLPRKPLLRIRVGDGREVLAGSHAQYQVIVRDAFQGRSVPAHLKTVEWLAEVGAHLRNDGIYLANASHYSSAPARPDVAAVARAFAHQLVIAPSKVLKGARRGNLVIAGWNDPGLLDLGELDRQLRRLPLPVSLLHGTGLSRWLGGAPPASDADRG